MENGKCSSALLVLENEYQNFLTFPPLNICLTYTYRGRQTELPFANFFFRCLWELGWSRSQSQELGAQSRSPNWVLRTHCWSRHLLPSQVYVTLDLSQKPRSDLRHIGRNLVSKAELTLQFRCCHMGGGHLIHEAKGLHFCFLFAHPFLFWVLLCYALCGGYISLEPPASLLLFASHVPLDNLLCFSGEGRIMKHKIQIVRW